MFQLFSTCEIHNSQLKIFSFTFLCIIPLDFMRIFIFYTITLQIRLIPVQFSIVDKIAFLSLTSDILFVRFSTSTRHLCIGSLIQ